MLFYDEYATEYEKQKWDDNITVSRLFCFFDDEENRKYILDNIDNREKQKIKLSDKYTFIFNKDIQDEKLLNEFLDLLEEKLPNVDVVVQNINIDIIKRKNCKFFLNLECSEKKEYIDFLLNNYQFLKDEKKLFFYFFSFTNTIDNFFNNLFIFINSMIEKGYREEDINIFFSLLNLSANEDIYLYLKEVNTSLSNISFIVKMIENGYKDVEDFFVYIYNNVAEGCKGIIPFEINEILLKKKRINFTVTTWLYYFFEKGINNEIVIKNVVKKWLKKTKLFLARAIYIKKIPNYLKLPSNIILNYVDFLEKVLFRTIFYLFYYKILNFVFLPPENIKIIIECSSINNMAKWDIRKQTYDYYKILYESYDKIYFIMFLFNKFPEIIKNKIGYICSNCNEEEKTKLLKFFMVLNSFTINSVKNNGNTLKDIIDLFTENREEVDFLYNILYEDYKNSKKIDIRVIS